MNHTPEKSPFHFSKSEAPSSVGGQSGAAHQPPEGTGAGFHQRPPATEMLGSTRVAPVAGESVREMSNHNEVHIPAGSQSC